MLQSVRHMYFFKITTRAHLHVERVQGGQAREQRVTVTAAQSAAQLNAVTRNPGAQRLQAWQRTQQIICQQALCQQNPGTRSFKRGTSAVPEVRCDPLSFATVLQSAKAQEYVSHGPCLTTARAARAAPKSRPCRETAQSRGTSGPCDGP